MPTRAPLVATTTAINSETLRRQKAVEVIQCSESDVEADLMAITNPLANEIRAQYSACRSAYLTSSGDKRAPATLI